MKRLIAVCLLLFCATSPVRAEEIAVAAASDLNFAIKEVIAEFEKQAGHHVKLSLGSSGNFFAQLQQGAPFDLYFSADIGYPKKLEEAGLTVPGSLYRYAVGRVVLWAPKGAPLEVSKGLAVLRDPAIRKIAIANPKACSLRTRGGCRDGACAGVRGCEGSSGAGREYLAGGTVHRVRRMR